MQASIDPSDYQAVATGMRSRLARLVSANCRLKAAIREIASTWGHPTKDTRVAIRDAKALIEEIEADEGVANG